MGPCFIFSLGKCGQQAVGLRESVPGFAVKGLLLTGGVLELTSGPRTTFHLQPPLASACQAPSTPPLQPPGLCSLLVCLPPRGRHTPGCSLCSCAAGERCQGHEPPPRLPACQDPRPFALGPEDYWQHCW